MNILILEDTPARIEQFREHLLCGSSSNHVVFVTTARDCISNLDTVFGFEWDAVFLDHDLGGESLVESGQGTGYEVACWLEQNPDKIPDIVVIHSMNPNGAERMAWAIGNSGHIVFMAPGIWSAGNLGDYMQETLADWNPYIIGG